jgi:hypothetical protein
MGRSRYINQHMYYGSAKDYRGIKGLVDVEKFW